MRAVAPGVLAAVLAVRALPAEAQPAPDLARARELYQAAEAALGEARHDDAVRDYGAAYELSRDPALFYKLGRAHERAGRCDAALIYYRRYLAEGTPSEEFAKLTAARIEACGGAPGARGEAGPDASDAPPPPPPPEPETSSGAGGAPTAEPGPSTGATLPGSGEGGAAPAARPAPRLGRHRGPWLLVGGSIGLLTAAAVLAYSANAAERDVEDLYVGLNGTPPPFNGTTRRLYDDAIAEGRRYQTLSLVGFGLAGAMAAGAAIWFALDRDEQVTVAPAVAPGAAGASATIRF